jgi:DNA-directed RNA polymerase beta subunit
VNRYSELLIKKYFEEHSFVASDIESFNGFVDYGLQKIVDQNKVIEPTIIPHNIDDFKIRFDKIWVTKPEITEADGSKREINPAEARLRKLSYAAPIFIEVSAHINGIQRESFTTQVGSLPIMLRSKYCHLAGLSSEDLLKRGEDPTDPGGYFIINGTERVLIKVEDLAANNFMVSNDATKGFVGKLFSSFGSYKIPHSMEKLKDGLFYLTFTRVKRIPIIPIIKALGLTKDEDILRHITAGEENDSVFVNLFEFVDIKTEEESLDYVAKKIGITQAKDIRIERMQEIIDKYLLPHLGVTEKDRLTKAYNLCKFIRKYLRVTAGELPVDDKDHYKNKQVKMSGDLLAELFQVNLKVLIGDLLYNFQRIVKRGKFPSIKVVIRDKLLTSRIYSSMATGSWVGGRTGVSQRIQRINFLESLSHLQRVISPLSASQENFAAREIHATHLGRLCPIETPEGTNIGLRKNSALLAEISHDSDEEVILKQLKMMGLKTI